MAAAVRAVRIGRADVFSPCEFDLARMLRFPMIVVDFLHIAHKIHRDHETAARARTADGPIASARPPSGLRRAAVARNLPAIAHPARRQPLPTAPEDQSIGALAASAGRNAAEAADPGERGLGRRVAYGAVAVSMTRRTRSKVSRERMPSSWNARSAGSSPG